ncbi:GpE family phage tail protein [Chitiniphilus eburneus]
MADCSTVFSFSMDEYDRMTLADLGRWRERARVRSGGDR